MMYFTEAEWEGVGDKRKGRRSKRGQRREKKCKNEASRFGDELKAVTLKNCFKVVQKSTYKELYVTKVLPYRAYDVYVAFLL